MKKFIFLLYFLFFGIASTFAQRYDFGLWLGGATYFGDLNTLTNFRFTNPAGGGFARVNFDDRISFRINLAAGHVWADDAYSPHYYERTRNLGFASNIYELSSQFEFNFIPFTNFSTNAYTEKHRYSPYVFAGFGAFHFNPTANYNGNNVALQPIGTEGQGYPGYDLKKYHRVSSAILMGGGIKFRMKRNIGIQFEGGVRKTSTDYLDDVSGVYADPLILDNEGGGPEAAFLSDPSVEVTGEPVGVPGKMRGDNRKNDDYFFLRRWAHLHIKTI